MAVLTELRDRNGVKVITNYAGVPSYFPPHAPLKFETSNPLMILRFDLLSSAVNCISEVTFPGPAEFVAKAVILYGTPVSMWKRVQD